MSFAGTYDELKKHKLLEIQQLKISWKKKKKKGSKNVKNSSLDGSENDWNVKSWWKKWNKILKKCKKLREKGENRVVFGVQRIAYVFVVSLRD